MTVEEAQTQRLIRFGFPHPTPRDILASIETVFLEDAKNPETPNLPMHVYALIRDAIRRANEGEFDK